MGGFYLIGDPEGTGMQEGEGEPGNRRKPAQGRLLRRPLRTCCLEEEKKRNEVFSFPFREQRR